LPEASACDGAITFSDDFHTTGFQPAWRPPSEQYGTVRVATSDLPGSAVPTSTPGALLAHIQIPADAGPPPQGSSAAFVRHTISGAASSVHASYSLLVSGTGLYAEMGCVLSLSGSGDSATRMKVYLQAQYPHVLYANVNQVSNDAGAAPEVELATLDNAAWYDVTLDATLDDKSGVARISIGPHDKTTPPITQTLQPFGIVSGYSGVDLACGVLYADRSNLAGGAGTLDVAIDDLSVVACPR
jgi:hypothetical protein